MPAKISNGWRTVRAVVELPVMDGLSEKKLVWAVKALLSEGLLTRQLNKHGKPQRHGTLRVKEYNRMMTARSREHAKLYHTSDVEGELLNATGK